MKNMNVNKKVVSESGYTLSGMLFNVTCASMVMLGTGAFSNLRGLPAMMTFSDLNSKGQAASSVLAQDIRRANGVVKANAHELVLNVPGSSQGDTVSYTYDPSGCTLTRRDHNGNQLLLTQVDSFAFSVFQRTAALASQQVLVPASAGDARAVACSWSCSRKLLGAKLGADNVQMGPMVLRNRAS
jgi:hypothetical protein